MTDRTTPASELRAAADKLRQLATAATPGPWQQSGIGDYGWTVTFSRPGAGVEGEDGEQGRADADYIAAMHPGVGAALAAWLESWTGIDLYEAGSLPEDARHALDLARQVLGPTAEAGR